MPRHYFYSVRFPNQSPAQARSRTQADLQSKCSYVCRHHAEDWYGAKCVCTVYSDANGCELFEDPMAGFEHAGAGDCTDADARTFPRFYTFSYAFLTSLLLSNGANTRLCVLEVGYRYAGTA